MTVTDIVLHDGEKTSVANTSVIWVNATKNDWTRAMRKHTVSKKPSLARAHGQVATGRQKGLEEPQAFQPIIISEEFKLIVAILAGIPCHVSLVRLPPKIFLITFCSRVLATCAFRPLLNSRHLANPFLAVSLLL